MLQRLVAVGTLLALTILTGLFRPSSADDDRPDVVAISDSTAISLFDGARLLAGYGESRRAYSLTPVLTIDPAVDRERLRLEVRLMTELGMYDQADSSLAIALPLVDQDRVYEYYLQRANLNLLSGRFGRALDFLAHTDTAANSAFEAYADYIRLRANLGLERPGPAIEAGERGLRRELPASLTPDFELALVEAYSMGSRPEDALGVVTALKRRIRRSGEMAELLEMDYRLRLEADDIDAARKTAATLSTSYRRTIEAKQVGLDFLDRVPAATLSNDELLGHAGAMVDHGQFRHTRDLLKVLDQRKLNNRQRELRSIVKARYYYYTGEYRRSIALAKPRFSVQAYRRESMLILARSYRQTGDKRKAADVYSYFAKVYPNDVKAAEALYVAARLYESSGARQSSQGALYKLRKSYPSSYFGKMAAYRGAAYYSKAGKHNTSVTILERVVNRSRRTDDAAMYYLADTYGRTGRGEDKQLLLQEIETLKPFSFYLTPDVDPAFHRPPTTSTGEVALDGDTGLLAFLTVVNEHKELARTTLVDAFGSAGGSVVMGREAEKCVTRGTWFLDVGFRDWGERELDRARRRCYESPPALLELGRVYDRYGMPWHGIRLYQRVHDMMHWKKRRAYSEAFRYLMYPVPYPVQVMENAARYDLPPHLVYAIIREESRFDRGAVSRVGAIGLMQLMPETGRYVARELEMPEWGDESLLDPEINLSFGTWYASSLMKSSKGNYLRMLAAYNAGPGNAKRWFDGSQAGNTIDVVDGIDFKETRLYVQRIVESANIYHNLYFDSDSPLARD
jgi:soluble lytic murein transglycosylase